MTFKIKQNNFVSKLLQCLGSVIKCHPLIVVVFCSIRYGTIIYISNKIVVRINKLLRHLVQNELIKELIEVFNRCLGGSFLVCNIVNIRMICKQLRYFIVKLVLDKYICGMNICFFSPVCFQITFLF